MVTVNNKLWWKAPAAVGFAVALLELCLLLWPVGKNWAEQNQVGYLILCPPSLISMGFDNAGWAVGTAVWILMIAPANAVLYALAVGALRYLLRRPT